MVRIVGSVHTLGISELTGEPFRRTECRRPVRLVGYHADRTTGFMHAVADFSARCGSWRCLGCGRRLRALHMALVRLGVDDAHDAGGFARFLTLTFPVDAGARLEQADDVKNVTALVARLVQEIRRTHSPRLEYYAAKESTKRGRLHVHLVTTGPYLRKCRLSKRRPSNEEANDPDAVGWRNACDEPRGCQDRLRLWQHHHRGARPKPCIQAIAHRLGFGFVDVRKVSGAGEAAAYVAKYLTKQVGYDWPRHSRRSTYSRGRLQCGEPHTNDDVAEAHTNTDGRRCCDNAYRKTHFAPTTIGRLSAAWSLASLYAGIKAGVIDPPLAPEDIVDLPIDKWDQPRNPRAPPRIIPNIDLDPTAIVRRFNARVDSWREEALRLQVVDRFDPVPAEVLQAARFGPRLPHPTALHT